MARNEKDCLRPQSFSLCSHVAVIVQGERRPKTDTHGYAQMREEKMPGDRRKTEKKGRGEPLRALAKEG